MTSVYAYLDYRAFLSDWIAQRRTTDPGYSYAAFSRAGGCSKASIANVLSGARSPRPDTLDAFARAMELNPSERNYLGLLVELDAAPSQRVRRDVMDRILSTERFRQVRRAEHEAVADVSRYFEHWYIPAIREMAALPGFQEDPFWIACTLRPQIRPEEAQAAIDTLLDLGFLLRGPHGELQVREVRFSTSPQESTHGAAVAHVHREIVPGLLREMDTRNHAIQHLLAGTVCVAPSQLPEFRARMNALWEQLGTLGDDRSDDEPRRVYQLALQLLPLSDEVGE